MRPAAMRIGFRIVAALLLSSPVLSRAGDSELKPFTAAYSITWKGFSAGSTQVKLEHMADGRWSYSSQSNAHGLFRLAMPAALASRSVFHIQDDQVIPETFTADDGATSTDKDQNIVFDWAAGKVRGTAERKPVNLATQPGLLDSLSVQVALMHALLGGHVPERFVLLDKDRIKDYVYATQGKERLVTDAGTYDTVIFSSSRPGSANGTWFWCAPELGYLPLKVERREDKIGAVVDESRLGQALKKLGAATPCAAGQACATGMTLSHRTHAAPGLKEQSQMRSTKTGFTTLALVAFSLAACDDTGFSPNPNGGGGGQTTTPAEGAYGGTFTGANVATYRMLLSATDHGTDLWTAYGIQDPIAGFKASGLFQASGSLISNIYTGSTAFQYTALAAAQIGTASAVYNDVSVPPAAGRRVHLQQYGHQLFGRPDHQRDLRLLDACIAIESGWQLVGYRSQWQFTCAGGECGRWHVHAGCRWCLCGHGFVFGICQPQFLYG